MVPPLCVVFLVGGLACGLTGCGSIQPVSPGDGPITDPTRLYTRLILNHPAVMLSTDSSNPAYHTLQLAVTPLDASGNVMTGLPAPMFSIFGDTSRIALTSDGLVTARRATGTDGIFIIASVTVGPVTHADTAVIVITDQANPPALASLSIDPAPPDSATWPLSLNNTSSGLMFFAHYITDFSERSRVPATPETTTGDTIPDLPIEYESLDPLIATVDRRTGLATALRPGQVRIVAQTMAYGVAKTATATFTVTNAANQDVVVATSTGGGISIPSSSNGPLVFAPHEVKIRPYGIVLWQNRQGESVDVVFDDPAKATSPPVELCNILDFFVSLGIAALGSECGAGDILIPAQTGPTGYGVVEVRQFQEPGVYSYHSALTGATGRIVVTTEAD